MPDLLTVPQGEFHLTLPDARPNDPRRAWDAADELVSAQLDEIGIAPDARVLILNGGLGALATALASWRPTVVSDSFAEHRATVANLVANGVDPDDVRRLGPLDLGASDERFDVVVVKVPKSSALLEDELRRVVSVLADDAVVIGAAMARHVHTSTIDRFATTIGPTSTSRAVRKARLLLPTVDRSIVPSPSPWPVTVPATNGLVMVNHANVFSRERLDAGTRLLLDHLPEAEAGAEVVDLGCGNGILGTAVALASPDAVVSFVDDSFSAVASATATFAANVGDRSVRPARFVVGDCFDAVAEGEVIGDAGVDVVVNNPPFHDDHAVGDATAWRMFKGAHRVLRPGGELRVVGNRHLGYHVKLRRIFGNCEVVASNPKFVVLSARR